MPHLVATLIYLSQIYSYYISGDMSPLRELGRYASLSHNIHIAAVPLLWILAMLCIRAIALCTHNVYPANHDNPPNSKSYFNSLPFFCSFEACISDFK